MNWISVKDQLPNDYEIYVVYKPSFYRGIKHDIALARCRDGKWYHFDGGYFEDEITHWIPLPTAHEDKE